MENSGMTPATLRLVWEDNFKEEEELIKRVVLRHNYVTLTTRLIPIPAAPNAAASSSSASRAAPTTLEENYIHFRRRANAVRVFQLGLTFSDEGGNLPKDPVTGKSCIWEFNLKVAKHVAEIDDSFRQQLTEKGIDVDFNMKHAIHPDVFCLGFWRMNTLMHHRIRWVVFYGGASFGPLLNIMSFRKHLPEWREDFLYVVKLYFPSFYEVRQLMEACGLSGTLAEVAAVLGAAVTNGEAFNQAGPDSLLTLQVFLLLKNRYFRQGIPEDRANKIFSIS